MLGGPLKALIFFEKVPKGGAQASHMGNKFIQLVSRAKEAAQLFEGVGPLKVQ